MPDLPEQKRRFAPLLQRCLRIVGLGLEGPLTALYFGDACSSKTISSTSILFVSPLTGGPINPRIVRRRRSRWEELSFLTDVTHSFSLLRTITPSANIRRRISSTIQRLAAAKLRRDESRRRHWDHSSLAPRGAISTGLFNRAVAVVVPGEDAKGFLVVLQNQDYDFVRGALRPQGQYLLQLIPTYVRQGGHHLRRRDADIDLRDAAADGDERQNALDDVGGMPSTSGSSSEFWNGPWRGG